MFLKVPNYWRIKGGHLAQIPPPPPAASKIEENFRFFSRIKRKLNNFYYKKVSFKLHSSAKGIEIRWVFRIWRNLFGDMPSRSVQDRLSGSANGIWRNLEDFCNWSGGLQPSPSGSTDAGGLMTGKLVCFTRVKGRSRRLSGERILSDTGSHDLWPGPGTLTHS